MNIKKVTVTPSTWNPTYMTYEVKYESGAYRLYHESSLPKTVKRFINTVKSNPVIVPNRGIVYLVYERC